MILMVFIFITNLSNEDFKINFLFPQDYLFKFLIIGRAGVGKSCVLHHFIENKCKIIN